MRDLIIEAIINQSYEPTDDEFRIIHNKSYRYKIMNTVERLEWFLKQFDKAAIKAKREPASPKFSLRFNRAAVEKRLMNDNY